MLMSLDTISLKIGVNRRTIRRYVEAGLVEPIVLGSHGKLFFTPEMEKVMVGVRDGGSQKGVMGRPIRSARPGRIA